MPPIGAPPANNTQRGLPEKIPDKQLDDQRHPKIVAMMNPYIKKLRMNVYVGELLDSVAPIPTRTRFTSSNGICWNAVFGRCKFGKSCKFKRNHPAKGKLSEEYTQQVVDALQTAVTTVVATKAGIIFE
jgi:hypothetical protein